jgi:hypothetical protein
MEEKENESAKNDVVHEPEFDDNDNHFVPPSPPILRQQSQSIAADHPRRNIAHHKCLIEEYNILYML